MSAKDTAAPPATAKAPSSAAAGTGVIRWTVLLDEHARPPVRADGAGGWVRPPRVGALLTRQSSFSPRGADSSASARRSGAGARSSTRWARATPASGGWVGAWR
jgi:hypothetical protein